jgi:hypothetical protein
MNTLGQQIFLSFLSSVLTAVVAIMLFNQWVVKPHERRLEAQIQAVKEFSQLNAYRLDKHADTLNAHAAALSQLGQATASLSDTVNYNAEIANYNASRY